MNRRGLWLSRLALWAVRAGAGTEIRFALDGPATRVFRVVSH